MREAGLLAPLLEGGPHGGMTDAPFVVVVRGRPVPVHGQERGAGRAAAQRHPPLEEVRRLVPERHRAVLEGAPAAPQPQGGRGAGPVGKVEGGEIPLEGSRTVDDGEKGRVPVAAGAALPLARGEQGWERLGGQETAHGRDGS